MQGSRDIYVAMFNLTDAAADISLSFDALGLQGKIRVRDLWQRQDMGIFSDAWHRQINPHGAVLLRLSK